MKLTTVTVNRRDVRVKF